MNPYKNSQSLKAQSMSPQAQVSFVFGRIADNIDYSYMCFEHKEYEKFFDHVKKAIDLSNSLGQVINSIAKDAPEAQKIEMLPWVSYFESLICSINRYSVTHSHDSKEKIAHSVREMAKMWQNAKASSTAKEHSINQVSSERRYDSEA